MTMSDKGKFAREEEYSQVMKAGKRTYYFDVRTTKSNEYYLTITESRRQNNPDGSSHLKKHKIFLYKEDFEEFRDSFAHVLDYIYERQPKSENERERHEHEAHKKETNDEGGDKGNAGFTQIEFEDL